MKRTKAYKYCPECGRRFSEIDKSYKFSCPNGHVYYVSPKPTCSVIITEGKGKIFVTKRGENPHKGLWELPGGFISLNETLEETIKREIKEELGVKISITDIIGAFPTIYSLKGIDYETIGTLVVAKIIKGKPTPSLEATEIRTIGIEEITDLEFAFPVEKKVAIEFLKKN